MSFDKLLSELAQAATDQETLSKALPTEDGKDDEKIQAAAGEGGSGEGAGAADDGAGEGKGEGEGKELSKSFEVTLPDGSKAEAVDGTAMVKALNERMDASEGQVMKALEGAISLIKGQGEMIKSLGETVKGQAAMLKAIGNEGRGRKATLVLNDKQAQGDLMAKGLQDGMTGEELMAKAMDAQKGGFIQAKDVSMLENYLTRGATPPEQLVARIVAGAKK